MHTKPMAESDGKFKDDRIFVKGSCPKCGGSIYCKTWESSCGGYEDDKFTCSVCGYYWWVDGSDS